MKFTENGQMTAWLSWALDGIAAMLIIGFLLNDVKGWLGYSMLWGGLLLFTVGRYHDQAISLRIKPFEKFNWRKARESYTEDEKECAKSEAATKKDDQ